MSLSKEAMSLSNLPDNVQAEILMKLPVESILACKYLCKLWFKMISSPYFIKNHLHLTTQRNNNFRLMFCHWSKRQDGKKPVISSTDYASLLPLSLSCQHLRNVPMDYPINPFRYEDVKRLRILGSCNGLICLKVVTYDCDIIYIWNPSTKEHKRVPECDFSSSKSNSKYGFGFDKTINDYKVVRIPFDKDGMCSNIQVYTLGLNSWHNVQTITYWLNLEHKYWESKFVLGRLLFKGSLHWLGLTTQGTSSDFIISFELSNERLVQFPFPKGYSKDLKGDEELHKSVGVLGDCICLNIGYRAVGDCMDIWVMQDYGVQESWTKRFTITQRGWEGWGYFPCKPIWSLENGEILLSTRSELILYDPNTGKVREAIPSNAGMCMDVEIYVESLASVNTHTQRKE